MSALNVRKQGVCVRAPVHAPEPSMQPTRFCRQVSQVLVRSGLGVGTRH